MNTKEIRNLPASLHRRLLNRSRETGEAFAVTEKKEEKQFGEYHTRRLVLAAWERLHTKGLMPEGYNQRKNEACRLE